MILIIDLGGWQGSRKSSSTRKDIKLKFNEDGKYSKQTVRFGDEMSTSQSLNENRESNYKFDDMEDINNITLQLSQKEKHMETNKLEEEYQEIKSRMREIMYDYRNFGKKQYDDFNYSHNSSRSLTSNLSILSGEDLLDEQSSNEDDGETNDRNNIFNVLRNYEVICKERQHLLDDIFHHLHEYDTSYNCQVEELDDACCVTLQMLQNLSMKRHQLLTIHNKLMKMSMDDQGSKDMENEVLYCTHFFTFL